MATDDWGGVALDEPKKDDWGGVAVAEQKDDWGGVALEPSDYDKAIAATQAGVDAMLGPGSIVGGTFQANKMLDAQKVDEGKKEDFSQFLDKSIQPETTPLGGVKAPDRSFAESATDFAMTPQLELISRMSPEGAGNLARNLNPVFSFLPKEVSNRVAGIAQNVTADTLNFFTSPLGMSTLGLGAAPAGLQKIVAGLFAAHAAKEGPETLRAILEAKTPEERDQAITAGLESAMVLVGGAKHAAGRPLFGGLGVGEVRPPSLTQEAADTAGRANQLRALTPEGVPLTKDAQRPVNPDTIDGLTIARERLSRDFQEQPKEVQAQRQTAIDEIDDQLLQFSREDAQASAERIAQRGESRPPASEAAPEVPAGGPPTENGRSSLFEQARRDAGQPSAAPTSASPANTFAERTAKIQEEGRRATPEEREQAQKEKEDFRKSVDDGDTITVTGETIDDKGNKTTTTTKYRVESENGRLVATPEGGGPSMGLEPDSGVHFFNKVRAQAEGGKVVRRTVEVEKKAGPKSSTKEAQVIEELPPAAKPEGIEPSFAPEARVKIRDFDEKGRIGKEVEMHPEEAGRKLRARESAFKSLLDCLGR